MGWPVSLLRVPSAAIMPSVPRRQFFKSVAIASSALALGKHGVQNQPEK